MVQVGQIVISKAGRDKGLPFLVVSVKDKYLLLCDGKTRLAVKPKQKKEIHVQKTNTVYSCIAVNIESYKQSGTLDCKVRKAIAMFKKETQKPCET